jgi:regulator of nucleoside diphosphate kinase
MYASVADPIQLPPICLVEADYELLCDLVCSSARPTPGIELLWKELQRAVIVGPERAPSGLVRLRSVVSFTDVSRAARRAAQIVAPGEPEERDGVSVVSSTGAALIGLRSGDTFRWQSDGGRIRVLRVDAVAEDPQQAARRRTLRAAATRRQIDEILSRH